ncbi:MAG: 50S ribosomal protein L11 methyltransferase [Burkholderiales bacterium]
MPWQSVTLPATEEEAEILSEALMESGALAVTIEDAAAGTVRETPLFGEPGMPVDTLWQRNLVICLFAQDADVPSLLQNAASAMNYRLPDYRIEAIAEQDWVRLTQAEFAPISISERLWIVPSWHDAPNPNAINLVLDPGLAFGTGSHPTTRLCLQWLEQNVRATDDVLDYGCGSGILAIAALKFGANHAYGIDIDPLSITTARDNALGNRVQAEFYLPDADPGSRVSIVVANILTNPLLALAPLLADRCRPGGKLVLSGILDEQADKILDAYRTWFDLTVWRSEDGWVCLSGIKRH